MTTIDISYTEEIYSVSRLNREVKLLLQGSFPLMWVEGEISNFTVPQSGHWYFSLKDSTAQVRCCMFKPQNRRLTFTPKDGTHVILKASISLYEGRGEYQLIVEHMEEAGTGKLQKEFEALKKKLSEAGLFDQSLKKSLPSYPKTIGVVTSPTGAAIRDILSVLKRRYTCANIIIYPTAVQGEAAAGQIVRAIEIANERKECDVLILSRGGGSLEDLWSFNEEKVARAIFKSTLPIISGVGHEIDFTIADFVADMRAPTPSAAAELVTPNCLELLQTIEEYKICLYRLIKHKLSTLQQESAWTLKHLQQFHPKRRLAEQQQRLDYCEVALVRLQSKILSALTARTENLHAKLLAHIPKHLIRQLQQQTHVYLHQLHKLIHQKVQSQHQTLSQLAGKIDALSPLSTLQRGYAIATLEKDKTILQSSKQVKKGDKISLQLMDGKIGCSVD